MGDGWIYIVVLCVLAIIIKAVRKSMSRRGKEALKELPHPFAWPLIGNYFEFTSTDEPYEYLKELGQKYGAVFRIQLGSQPVLILNDYDIIREALVNPKMASRPEWLSMTVQSERPYHFAFRRYGPEWKFLRKTSVKALTVLKSSESSRVEQHCRTALRSLRRAFRDSNGQPLDPSTAIFRCVCTVMGLLAFGDAFDADDPVLNTILNSALDTSRLTKVGSCTDVFPLTAGLFRNLIDGLRRQNDVFDNYVIEKIKAHKANERITDLADALSDLAAQYPTDSEESRNCRFVAIDLFGAGFFTTMTNLEWALLILAKRLDVQKRMREELTRCCRGDEFIAWDQKRNLPYAEAVLYEVLRYCTVLPFGVPHGTWTEETELRGFRVPAGTPIFPNLWAVHRDERLFPQPYQFNPDRFLTNDNALDTTVVANVISFSTGIRRCPGEFLAKRNLFLILTNIIFAFELTLASNYENLQRCEMNFSRKPLPYRLIFTPLET